MKFERVLKEVGLENRLDILHMLRENPATVSDMRSILRKKGISKPYITVNRYLENLKNVGLLCEKDGTFHLSLVGRLLLGYFDEAEEKIKAINKFSTHLQHPIDYLPGEFLKKLDVLQYGRVLTDQYSITLETLLGLEMAEKEVLVIAGNTVSPEYTIAAFKRSLGGIKERIINDTSIVEQDIAVYKDLIRRLGLSDKDVKKIKENRRLRIYPGLTLRVMIIDDKMAGIALPESGRMDMITPAFQSENKEFIAWVKDIFEWYWERADLVEW
jgi:predicted transcriptional regulator